METQCLVAYHRESWKRFIEIVLSKVPTFIKQYPPNSQTMLNDFFDTIKHHEKAAFDRKGLSNRFKTFSDKYYMNDDYIKTAFLWFAIEYLKNANRLLSIAEFHASDFYHYLATYFRGNKHVTGIFQLIKSGTPLYSLKWEELQYSCSKLQFSLSGDQVLFLNALYSLVSESELKLFEPRRLKYSIESEMKTSSLSRKLPNLLTQLEDRWNYWLSYAAFGLSNVYVDFRLHKSVSLEDIIDLANPKNTTLTNSRLFQTRGSPDTYSDFLVIPSNIIDLLITHFSKNEQNGRITVNQLNTITNLRYSASLNLYQNERGWSELSNTELGRLAQKLKTQQPRKGRTKSLPFFLTKKFEKWSYLEYQDPSKMIQFFCENYSNFAFSDLITDSDLNEQAFSLNKADSKILKHLYQNNVVQLFVIFSRLILGYSIDQYLIKIPIMPLSQLSRLLTYLPWAELYFTSNNILMITYLRKNFVEWVKEELHWPITNIIEFNIPTPPTTTWYNHEKNQWLVPEFIRE